MRNHTAVSLHTHKSMQFSTKNIQTLTSVAYTGALRSFLTGKPHITKAVVYSYLVYDLQDTHKIH